MTRQKYIERDFKGEALTLIDTMNDIVDEYVADGYRLTVRQLYYQMVARGHIENTLQSYKRLAGIINDAKLAGLMDWDAMEDRTREFLRLTRWKSGAHILKAVAEQFHMDMWEGQNFRVFVVVEKEALAGVLERVCNEYDIPLLAARGYPSGTVLREFTESDLLPLFNEKEKTFRPMPVILHLGDHDPSGIDMSRDLSERFRMFITGHGTGKKLPDSMFTRIALNIAQVRQINPPENPAKTTDARFESYRKLYGESSWELDALPPDYLTQLIRDNVSEYIDQAKWDARAAEVEEVKQKLLAVAEDF